MVLDKIMGGAKGRNNLSLDSDGKLRSKK